MSMHERKVWLVPVDGSEQSLEAFDHALSIMNKEKDSLVLLHLYNVQPSTVAKLTQSGEALEQRKEDIQHEAAEFMKRCEKIAREAKVHFTSYVKESTNIKEDIVLQSGFLGADYIIMGSRGLGSIPKLVLGSTSEYCLAHATVPVMIVKKESWKNETGLSSDTW